VKNPPATSTFPTKRSTMPSAAAAAACVAMAPSASGSQGLKLVHVRAQLERLLNTFMS